MVAVTGVVPFEAEEADEPALLVGGLGHLLQVGPQLRRPAEPLHVIGHDGLEVPLRLRHVGQ